MVAPRGGPPMPAEPVGSSAPDQRDPSALDTALSLQAESALAKAGLMQPGGERAAAVRKAKVLANAAEILRHFSGRVGLRTK
ncbi:MAG: hypothetical protein ACK46T_40080 [Bradyrhizobium sp.]|jgi:hypothetical protein